MTNVDSKKTMKIAMVGVSPADQITFKGYLRVLLRLDVDLDWVSAQVGDVDLYVINEDFKTSNSVQRLVEVYPRTPILYTSRSLTGEGGISGNSLVLPLKQINILNDWLHERVGILKDMPYQKSADIAPTSHDNQQIRTTSQPITSSVATFNDVIEMIKTLNTRPDYNFELIQDGEVLALINPTRQLVWLRSAKIANIMTWRLRVYTGALGEPKQAIDMNQWLYQSAWANSDRLLALVNPQTHYQLRSWAKPNNNADRRTILRVMVALEDKARTIDEVVAHTGISRLLVQKVVVSLLISQHLHHNNYQNLVVNPVAINTSVATPSAPTPIPRSEPAMTPKTAEQEERIGFLARLRRKLGI